MGESGKRIDKYLLMEEIGHGGMATVYRARDETLGREVALKLLHPHLQKVPEAKERFHREAQSVAKLRHPRILEIFDYSGRDSVDSFISTELLTGPTLKGFGEMHAPLLPEVVASIALELVSALKMAHAAGIVHRDVKPENILIHENREIKLADFGIAQIVDAAQMTVTGQVIGSPGHMSPEQVQGKNIDERSDVFSLGTVMYYLSTGQLPFPGKNAHQVLLKILDADFIDPIRLVPGVGDAFKRILVKSMKKELLGRYQTMGELEQDLKEFLAVSGLVDPHKNVEKFLQDPTGATATLQQQVVGAWIEEGKKKKAQGDIRGSAECASRVLAMDPTSKDAISLLQHAKVKRKQTTVLLGLMGSMGLVGVLGLSVWGFSQMQPAPTKPLPIAPARPTATRDQPLPIKAEATPQAAPVILDNETAKRAVSGPRVIKERTVRYEVRYEENGTSQRLHNFNVQVDGGAWKVWSPNMTAETLVVGRHEVVFGSDSGFFSKKKMIIQVNPDPGPYVVSARLEFAPAAVFVRCNVREARVKVGEKLGRAWNMLTLPMSARRQSLMVFVSADGYESKSLSLVLEAGKAAELQTELKPAP